MTANAVFGLILMLLIIGFITYSVRYGGAAMEFGVILPSNYQMRLYNERYKAQRDWLDLINAVDLAKAKRLPKDYIERLETAKDNARERLDTIEHDVTSEKALIFDRSKFDLLLEKWEGVDK